MYQPVFPELLGSDEPTHHQLSIQLVQAWRAVEQCRLGLQVGVLGGLHNRFNSEELKSGPPHLLEEALEQLLALVSLRESLLSLASEVEVELGLCDQDELQLHLRAAL